MANVVNLDYVEHKDLKVKLERGEAYGDNVNQAIVFPTEFRDLQREYPIFFRKNEDGTYRAVALLGLDYDENLFLDDGKWDARYIPSVLARGPFSLGMRRGPDGNPEGDPNICIDLDSPAVNSEKGASLFLPQGGHAPYLEYVLGVLQRLHKGVRYSSAFFKALTDLDLIDPVTVEIKVSEDKQYSVPDVHAINEERFMALPGDVLEQLNKAGFLALCHWVLASMDNVNHLVELKGARGRL